MSYLRYDVLYICDENEIKYCTHVTKKHGPLRNHDGDVVDLHVCPYFKPVAFEGNAIGIIVEFG